MGRLRCPRKVLKRYLIAWRPGLWVPWRHPKLCKNQSTKRSGASQSLHQSMQLDSKRSSRWALVSTNLFKVSLAAGRRCPRAIAASSSITCTQMALCVNATKKPRWRAANRSVNRKRWRSAPLHLTSAEKASSTRPSSARALDLSPAEIKIPQHRHRSP